MAINIREVEESPVQLGPNEEWAYKLDTIPWGGTPSNVSVTIKNSAGKDLSATLLSGSSSVSGDEITTKVVSGLTAGKNYRLFILFTNVYGNVCEAWCDIECE